MRVLIGAVAALALAGSGSASAQGVYVAEPAPAPYYAPGPVVVAPAPPTVYVAPGYDAYASGPYSTATVVNPRTGRWCRIEEDGYRFCWTP
jgi:hypothetical protein